MAMPSTDTHSTVSSTITHTCGFWAMLRALRASGAHEKTNVDDSGCHTPHTGIAAGRPAAFTVTTQ